MGERLIDGSWLADGVKAIELLTRKAMITKPEIMALPLEKAGTYAITTPGPAGEANTVDVRVAGPTWHEEQLADPEQLAAFIQSMEERGVSAGKGAVYINESRVTYVYDFEDRRNRASCPLVVSQPWAWLAGQQKPMSQRDIIRVLRITFDGCLRQDSNLVSLLRNVRFKEDGSAEANLQRGKEALGRQILREVSGVADFPDEFFLHLSVYENFNSPVVVRVALEILTAEERFEMIPFPSQIHNGQASTLEAIRQELAETGVPTFIGAVGV